jgi:hypothetical protein
LEGGPPSFSPRFTGADLLRNAIERSCSFVYGTIALCGARFHVLRLPHDFVTLAGGDSRRTRALQPLVRNAYPLTRTKFGLIPFRSPLLGESLLIYFPRGTEMFHFPRLSSPRLCVQRGITPHYRRWVYPFGDPRVNGYSAPNRGLSQPFTSFIDSWCQGIHHVPLLS